MGRWLSPGRQTVGALDFGGASTQITFVTKDEVEDARDRMKLRLYGHDYSLYTHSFLCYGRDQVLKRLLAHLVTVGNILFGHNNITTTLYSTARAQSLSQSCHIFRKSSWCLLQDTIIV